MSAAPAPGERPERSESSGAHAALVAAGILLSRILGLVRQRVFGHYFGVRSDAADAFNAAFKIPNFLQNLFGEGVLSASFIPAYASLLADGDEEEAGRLAGAIFALLAVAVSGIVLVGVVATPLLIDLIAAGFRGEKRALAIHIVRILFPGAGLLVLSAWCLGILNSHRKFFLSYAAPVLWNVAMIATLVIYGGRVGEPALAIRLAWGSVIGSALQFIVQLPSVLGLVRKLRVRWNVRSPSVRSVVHSFVPVFVGRGVVQISSYVDQWIASWLPTGAVTGLQNAQTLTTLPISLFGMAVSAAELPAMSGLRGDASEVARRLRARLDAGLRRIAFFIVPSAAAFLALGDVITALLFQTGKFGRADSVYVWGIIAGSAVGLLASTMGRLYASAFYALRDTRTPLRFALLRVALTTGLGLIAAFLVPRWLGIDSSWGAAGLTASAGVAGWVEFLLLRRSLNARIGETGLPSRLAATLWAAAGVAAVAAWGVKLLIGIGHPWLQGPAILATFAGFYGAVTLGLGIDEADALLARVLRRR